MKRRGEKDDSEGAKAERRRRQFEEARGLGERRSLPLDDEEPPEGELPVQDEADDQEGSQP